jgi:quercetin dioxygenase-like cupin family protein
VKALVFIALFAVPARASDDDMGRRVQALLATHRADVFGCVQASGTTADGEMLVRVMVGERGQVAQADVLKDQSGGGKLGACLVAKVRAWDVTALGADPGDQVVFPLAFKPGATVEKLAIAPGARREVPHKGELALYVLRGPVKVNGTALADHDVIWMPPGTPCRVETRAAAEVLKIEAPGKGSGVTTVHAADVKSLPIAGGRGAVKLYLDGKPAAFAVDSLTADAGVRVPAHTHATSDEIIYVLSGKGTTTVAGKPVPTTPGQVIHIPAGVEHALTVDEKLVTVQVYAPGGPEQRFKGPTK